MPEIQATKGDRSMAYHMDTNTYECDWCGAEMGWNERNGDQGTMWECECCEKHFCSKCFIHSHGEIAYENMMQIDEKVYCPKCWKEKRME